MGKVHEMRVCEREWRVGKSERVHGLWVGTLVHAREVDQFAAELESKSVQGKEEVKGCHVPLGLSVGTDTVADR